MSDKVWVVMATNGEYSDRREWALCAYRTEQAAKDKVDELSEKVRKALSDLGDNQRPYHLPYEEWAAWDAKKAEAVQELDIGTIDDLDVRFFLYEVDIL